LCISLHFSVRLLPLHRCIWADCWSLHHFPFHVSRRRESQDELRFHDTTRNALMDASAKHLSFSQLYTSKARNLKISLLCGLSIIHKQSHIYIRWPLFGPSFWYGSSFDPCSTRVALERSRFFNCWIAIQDYLDLFARLVRLLEWHGMARDWVAFGFDDG
jgi:hypothetical protein